MGLLGSPSRPSPRCGRPGGVSTGGHGASTKPLQGQIGVRPSRVELRLLGCWRRYTTPLGAASDCQSSLRSATAADRRDATVEADRPRAGDAPVCAVVRAMSCACSLALRYLRARRLRGRRRMAMPGAGESPGGFLRLPPSFVRLGLQEGDANGVGDAHSKFDPTATGPSGRAIADHVVRLLAVDPQWRALLPVAMRLCTETLANLCKNDIVVFPERPRPACHEALVRRRHAAARRLQARQSGRRAPPRRRPGTAHELPRLRRPRAALQRLRASLRLFTPRPRVVPGMSDDGRAVAPPSPILTPSSLPLGDVTQASGRAPARGATQLPPGGHRTAKSENLPPPQLLPRCSTLAPGASTTAATERASLQRCAAQIDDDRAAMNAEDDGRRCPPGGQGAPNLASLNRDERREAP
jgi:hypothetical protein